MAKHVKNQAIYDENCKDNQFCIITFLPNAKELTKQEKDAYLNLISRVAEDFEEKKRPFVYFYVHSGEQPALEQQLGIESRFPTAVVISAQLKKFAVMKENFTKFEMKEFLSNFISGKVTFQNLEGKPVF